MFGILDSERATLGDAASRNFVRWPVLGEVLLGNSDPPPGSYEEELETLKTWLVARTRWMDEH